MIQNNVYACNGYSSCSKGSPILLLFKKFSLIHRLEKLVQSESFTNNNIKVVINLSSSIGNSEVLEICLLLSATFKVTPFFKMYFMFQKSNENLSSLFQSHRLIKKDIKYILIL